MKSGGEEKNGFCVLCVAVCVFSEAFTFNERRVDFFFPLEFWWENA